MQSIDWRLRVDVKQNIAHGENIKPCSAMPPSKVIAKWSYQFRPSSNVSQQVAYHSKGIQGLLMYNAIALLLQKHMPQQPVRFGNDTHHTEVHKYEKSRPTLKDSSFIGVCEYIGLTSVRPHLATFASQQMLSFLLSSPRTTKIHYDNWGRDTTTKINYDKKYNFQQTFKPT